MSKLRLVRFWTTSSHFSLLASFEECVGYAPKTISCFLVPDMERSSNVNFPEWGLDKRVFMSTESGPCYHQAASAQISNCLAPNFFFSETLEDGINQ